MKGFLLSRTIWSLCALFGAGCAVGVPLSFASTGNQLGTRGVGTQVSATTGDSRGGANSISSISN
ncbi:hypothetical protein MHM_04340 [Candidatus Mycoplasma haemominutum 'Birmingham 1']|uniref:Lipoprotein n=1 Tax=Candidatus Mycoplasma haematominutum 'Birmingham 1' TaxID=1116213 RepID=G8C3Q4_9MOLU|nr:hypothetical protein MHM_04340 [Candidatus Mycoplasma haematominutum 'Birmingham 1']